MSCSIVSRGLQSCLESSLTQPHVLRHKLSPPEPNSSQMYHLSQENEQETNKNGDWSFIKSITNQEVADNDTIYVHPLVKRSSSKLSEKSLEMCTESLGSETGSDNSDEFPPYLPSINYSKPRQFARKTSHSSSFPPPLTSISGTDGVRVRPHREDGRLVLKAETVTSNSSYLQAERVDGRLRLCLMIPCPPVNCDYEEEDDEMAGEYESQRGGEKCYDNDDNDQIVLVGNVAQMNLGSEFETGELARPRRCKEGGGRGRKEMQSWGAVWVASS